MFKEDTRTPSEVAESPGTGYNTPHTHLDPESLTMLLDWLTGLFGQ